MPDYSLLIELNVAGGNLDEGYVLSAGATVHTSVEGAGDGSRRAIIAALQELAERLAEPMSGPPIERNTKVTDMRTWDDISAEHFAATD